MPAKIVDRATFAKPQQYAVGMVHVLVNGVPVLRDGEHTGATPGRFVKGPGGWALPLAERIFRHRLIMGAVMAEAAFVEDELLDRLGRSGEGGVRFEPGRRLGRRPGGGGQG